MRPYTSHFVRNTTSATCTATIPPAIANATVKYPVTGLGRHTDTISTPPLINTSDASAGTSKNAANTCDRTVISGNLQWGRFPLLAPANEVENGLISDSSYNCTVTYDNNGGKTGLKTPSQGCCGPNVQVPSGTVIGVNGFAHLEPDVSCGSPKY